MDQRCCRAGSAPSAFALLLRCTTATNVQPHTLPPRRTGIYCLPRYPLLNDTPRATRVRCAHSFVGNSWNCCVAQRPHCRYLHLPVRPAFCTVRVFPSSSFWTCVSAGLRIVSDDPLTIVRPTWAGDACSRGDYLYLHPTAAVVVPTTRRDVVFCYDDLGPAQLRHLFPTTCASFGRERRLW